MDGPGIQRAVSRLARRIAKQQPSWGDLVLVGIQTGGVRLANCLAGRLRALSGCQIPVGELDVTMHRDDLDRRLAPPVHPTKIPVDITGKTVLLVDDVLFSGRTTRAALDALNDFGRPRRTQLAVLIDRGHRELPIMADFVGRCVVTALEDRIDVVTSETDGLARVTLHKAGRQPGTKR
jgi:pyrimidine operon attenuation protein / uracil phosphoribosyltransferase